MLSVSASGAPNPAAAGQAVTFSAAVSGGNPSSYTYSWSVDGVSGTINGANVTRNAPAGAATFSATVTVVDGSGNTASDKATVKVGAGAGVGLQPSYTLTLLNDPSNTLSVPRGGSASVVIALSGMNGYAGQPTLLAGPAPAGISVSFPYGAQETAGNVTAVVTAASTATTAPFALRITGKDGTNFPQGSVTIFVTLTGGPLNVTSSVVYSNIDPVAHTGTTATLVANATGGVGPYSYSWSGGGNFVGNRLTMMAPSSPVGGTLAVTDSSSPPLITSAAVTIPVSPVFSDAALHVAVLSRITASQHFANNLQPGSSGVAWFQNLVLNEANRQGAVLSPAEYASLMTEAKNLNAAITTDARTYRGVLDTPGSGGLAQMLQAGSQLQNLAQTQLGTPGHPGYAAQYLSNVQADLGSNFGGFDNFAWNNYAPDVEYDFGGDGTGVLYTSHYLLEDPGTGALWTSAQAWLESSNGVGSSLDLFVDLYHTSDHGEYQYRDVGGATFAYVEIGPVGPGHVSSDPTGQSGNSYTSDLSVSAEEWFADETTSSAYGSDTLMVAAMPCSPVIQGILVDGVPTNGFVVGKIGTLTVTGQCLDNVSLVSFQSAPGLSVTGPFTVSPVAGATVVGLEQFTGTYTVAAGSAPSQGYMNVTTPNGVSGPYSPIVVAPSLPYVTSILANPIPWQAGSANNYFFVVGAGFGASPSVSVTLASGAQVGQITLNSCAVLSCQDSVIPGTVSIPAEATPDVATITVGYNGYGNGFQGPPPGNAVTASIPVNAFFGPPTITNVLTYTANDPTSTHALVDPNSSGTISLVGTGFTVGGLSTSPLVTITDANHQIVLQCATWGVSPCSSATDKLLTMAFALSNAVIGNYSVMVQNLNGSSASSLPVVPQILLLPPLGLGAQVDITGRNSTTVLTAVVGQQVALDTNGPLPAGVTMTGILWTVPGTSVGGFPGPSPNSSGGQEQTVLNQSATTFYWVDAGSLRQVQCQVTLSNGAVLTSYSTFNVVGPSSPMITIADGSVTVDTNILYDPVTHVSSYDPSGQQVLILEGLSGPPGYSFANHSAPFTAGIKIDAAATPPAGFSGQFVFIQLFNNYNITFTAPGYSPSSCSFFGLDGAYLSTGMGPSNGPISYFFDAPAAGLSLPTTNASVSFSATTYVMWQASGVLSIPVPLGTVLWSWSGYAAYSGTSGWALDTTKASSPPMGTFTPGGDFPTWQTASPPPLSVASKITTTR